METGVTFSNEGDMEPLFLFEAGVLFNSDVRAAEQPGRKSALTDNMPANIILRNEM